MSPLPPLVSRLLALGLLLALVVVAWVAGVQPVIARWHDTDAQIEQTRELLGRYRTISAGRAELEMELAYWRDEVLPESGVFPGNNRSIVAAELQNMVSNIVKQSAGELLSIQILREQRVGKLDMVSVRVQFSADVEALTRAFYELESVTPHLFIDNMAIRAGRSTRQVRIMRQRTPAAAEPAETLFVTCDVYGYMRGSS